MGSLTGDPNCGISMLRNGNVTCDYFYIFHVYFKIVEFRLSNLCYVDNIFVMSVSSMSYVDFKKWPCCPVEFKDQGPYQCNWTRLCLDMGFAWRQIHDKYQLKDESRRALISVWVCYNFTPVGPKNSVVARVVSMVFLCGMAPRGPWGEGDRGRGYRGAI